MAYLKQTEPSYSRESYRQPIVSFLKAELTSTAKHTAVPGALLHRRRHTAKAWPAVCNSHETSKADGHFELPGHISDSTELDQAQSFVVSTVLVLRSYAVRRVTEH